LLVVELLFGGVWMMFVLFVVLLLVDDVWVDVYCLECVLLVGCVMFVWLVVRLLVYFVMDVDLVMFVGVWFDLVGCVCLVYLFEVLDVGWVLVVCIVLILLWVLVW